MWHAWETEEKCTGFWCESPKEKGHLKDQGVDGRMGSKWTLGRLVGWGGVYFNRDYIWQIALCGSFFLERLFIKILFTSTNVNASGFVKVGMKLLNIGTLINRNAMREISLNTQHFN
jgi:hypothetical protein